MSVTPAGELRGRPGWALSARRAFLPLALILLAALGFLIVRTITRPTAPSIPAAPAAPANGARTASTDSTVAPSSLCTLDDSATRSPRQFAALTGLEVLWVAESGDGGILDLRYRVVDEEKASTHENHGSVPAIIDLESGRALTRQWMGHAHPVDSFQPDRNYWMLFLNPGELVDRGDRVAVGIGRAQLTGVRVR